MAFYSYSTNINPAKTASQIQELLGTKGAKQILFSYQASEIIGLSFNIELNGQRIPFKLPIRWQGCLDAMKKDKKVPRHFCTQEQAKRTAWRIVLRWLQAQFAQIEAGMADLAEIMMPYIQLGEQTFYEKLVDENFRQLEYK